MMLDAKRTFDEVIERLAPDAATRDEIFGNRIYQQLSSAVAGSQEFTAIAKLFELDQEGDYDLLVLDTPPSRNALDFLDAPGRLTGFFQGRAIRIFLRPAGLGGKIIGRGTGVVFSLLKRVTGVDLLEDLSVFFRSLGGLIDGFTERAERVGALLEDPATTFLIVTSPQHDPVEEAIFFHRKLREAGMPFGGMVVNRVHAAPETERRGARPSWSRSSARRWPSASPTRRTTRPRWPRATTRRSTTSRRSCARRRRSASPSSRTTCTTSMGSHRCEPICSRTRTRRRSARPAARRWRAGRRRACAARGRGGRRGRRGGSRAGASRGPRRAPRARVGRDAPGDRRRARARRCRAAGAPAPSRSSGAAQIAASRSHMRSSPPASARPAARAPTAASPRAPPTATSARSPSSNRRSAHASSPARGVRRAIRAQNARSGSSSSGERRQSPSMRRRPVASGTDIHGPPSVRAQAIGASDGSASSHSRSAVCSRRRRRPACSSAGRLAGRGLEVQDGDRRVVVAVQVGRGVERAWRRARARGRRRARPPRRRSRGPRRARARPTASSRRRPPPRARRRPGRSARGRRRSRWRRPTAR